VEEPDAEASRGPGRPRSVEADRAIVEATLEMIADDGYHALSMEAVAAAAGVGKATLYRRWPGKRELVADALATLNDGLVPLPPAGPTRDRARVLMEHVCRKEHTSLSGRIMPRMMAYRGSHPELFEDYLCRVIEPRRERMRTVLREGVERGDVRSDVSIHLAAQALTAPLLMLRMASPASQQPSPTTVDDLLDIIWPGVRADGA
jgi:AcrR family transcriptional regulator